MTPQDITQEFLEQEMEDVHAAKRRQDVRTRLRLVSDEESVETTEEMGVASKFWYTFKKSDIEPVEAIVGLVSVGWGVWVGNPLQSAFAVAPDIYAGAASVAPEWVWACATIIVGFLVLAGLGSGIRHLRRQGSFVAFLVWSMVSGASLTGNTFNTTAPVAYVFLAALCAWIYLRVGPQET
jgi:hypothetical protein